jgi:hypothetical protein
MLVSVLPVAFADADRQRQYEAVLAALEADADTPATVLLGNLGAFSPVRADMLVVRPASLALVVLVPHAGQLTMQALTHGPWQLDGQPLPDRAGAANPFEQYQLLLPEALAWLSEHLGLPAEELPPCTGMALFEAPLTFGPGVEAQLHHHAAATDFHLVGGAGQLPARLRQQLAAGPVLDADELLDWGEWLASEPYIPHSNGIAESRSLAEGLFENPTNFLEQKLRQLWRWLGAEDIPADPPYGAPPPADQHLRDQQEQARLHQLRQELLAELAQQRQEAAAREASRTQELAQLRQQLAQAGQPAAERQAEQQAQAALEESLRTARTELAIRNQELDTRLRQLEQLIEQVRKPVPAAPLTKLAGAPSAPRPAAPRPAAPKVVYRRMRQAERWGLVALTLGIMVAGGWGVVRWLHPAKSRPLITTQARPTRNDAQPAEYQAPAPIIIYDSVAQTSLRMTDTTSRRGTEATSADHEAAQPAEAASARIDSATAGSEPPRPPAADSAAASPTP